MGQLIVRNVDDDLIRTLKMRAAENGRSMEAEHREILRQSLTSDDSAESFKEWLLSMPDVGEDEDFDIPRDMPRDVEL